MNVILESLGDSIWQVGGGILLFLALVLVLALRSPEAPLSPWHRWLWTRIALLVCLALFLALSTGVGLFHAATAISSVEVAATLPVALTASARVGSSPQPTSMATLTAAPSPSPSPTPFPRLVPTPTQVLTTFCDAIDQQDLNTAWAQYAQALQKERASPRCTPSASRWCPAGWTR
jgi:hypothetical protein